MTDPTEVRVTSETGGSKGTKDRRYDLLPIDPLDEVARLYAFGASKYGEDHNWRKGYPLSLSYAALQRHATQWQNGEDVDEETGRHHMASVVFHAFTILEHAAHPEQYAEFDDRYKRPAERRRRHPWFTEEAK